ncbi:MAG: T9SS type A sorting domain-containing protein [Saprospiraceae bacterium]
MKQLILLATFLVFSLCARAQWELELEPNPFEATFQVDLTDFWSEPIAHAHVTNKTDQLINLRWEREIISAPPEWEFRICDTNACYNTSTYTNVVVGGQPNVPVPLQLNEGSLLDLHVLPRMVAGCAEVNIKLSDAADPGNFLDTIVFNVCVDPLTAVSESEKSGLRIYPNPTANFISLTKNSAVRQLWISNILGKRVKTFYTTFNGKYDISTLPDGIYLVSMVDLQGNVMKTVRVSKRNPRP